MKLSEIKPLQAAVFMVECIMTENSITYNVRTPQGAPVLEHLGVSDLSKFFQELEF